MILAFLRCLPISAMLSTRSCERFVLRRPSCLAREGVCSLPSMPRRAASPLGTAPAGAAGQHVSGSGGDRRRLDVQLVYFTAVVERMPRSSQWVSQPERLAALMERIDCTHRIYPDRRKVIAHAKRATQNLKVQALVFVGDAMEEKVDELCHAAGELGVPAFLCFQEGDDPIAEQAVSRDHALDPWRLLSL